MHYEQFYVKYKGLNKRYINYRFMSFSDLELSFWFEYILICQFLLELSCDQVSMETKKVILARFVDFDVTPTNA